MCDKCGNVINVEMWQMLFPHLPHFHILNLSRVQQEDGNMEIVVACKLYYWMRTLLTGNDWKPFSHFPHFHILNSVRVQQEDGRVFMNIRQFVFPVCNGFCFDVFIGAGDICCNAKPGCRPERFANGFG